MVVGEGVSVGDVVGVGDGAALVLDGVMVGVGVSDKPGVGVGVGDIFDFV